MTKAQYVKCYFEIMTNPENRDLHDRLLKLMKEDRITSGCYFLHNPHDNYHVRWFSDLTSKASQAKSFSRYIKRTNLWNYQYHLESIKEHYDQLRTFIEEQESLPYEETQMQLLIASDDIQYV